MQHLSSCTFHLTAKPQDASKIIANSVCVAGPYFQGLLMSVVDKEYAELLHGGLFNPYSQYSSFDNETGGITWTVNTLSDEATERIINPLTKRDSFEVKGLGIHLDVSSYSVETKSLKSLTDVVHEKQNKPERNPDQDSAKAQKDVKQFDKMKLSFVTPTAFKSRGEYIFMPNSRLLFQNLLMRYETAYKGTQESDEETVSYLASHAKIVSYDLRSHYFSNVAEGKKNIPAFMGNATISLGGPAPAIGLAKMLLMFGEYAGVGIKTSMGMGGFKCS